MKHKIPVHKVKEIGRPNLEIDQTSWVKEHWQKLDLPEGFDCEKVSASMTPSGHIWVEQD
jgi:hypothetical protein